MRVGIALFLSLACLVVEVSGCAGPLLNSYTESLGPRIGSIQEREVLTNLGRFIDNPWAIPGHVELNAGVIQVQNQIAVGYKMPDLSTVARAAGATLSSVTHSNTHEFDVNSAQTQDQESYNILPVTDADDLRRLRALYFYAVCPDWMEFKKEWLLAAQSYNTAPADSPPPPKTADEKVRDVVQSFAAGSITSQEAADQLEKLSNKKPLPPEERKIITDNLDTVATDINKATQKIMGALGIKPRPQNFAAAIAKGSPKDTSKSGPGSAGSDTFSFELAKYFLITDPDKGLGKRRWLYWRRPGGEIGASCPGERFHVAPNPSELSLLGSANGYELYTDDGKRFSDLVLFVLGGIPNTVGAHILDQTASVDTSKARNAPVTFNQTGDYVVVPSGKR